MREENTRFLRLWKPGERTGLQESAESRRRRIGMRDSALGESAGDLLKPEGEPAVQVPDLAAQKFIHFPVVAHNSVDFLFNVAGLGIDGGAQAVLQVGEDILFPQPDVVFRKFFPGAEYLIAELFLAGEVSLHR